MSKELETNFDDITMSQDGKFFVFWEHNVNPIDLRRKEEKSKAKTN